MFIFILFSFFLVSSIHYLTKKSDPSALIEKKTKQKKKNNCSPFSYYITKTCLYNFDPLKPHFYIVKLDEAVLTSTHNLRFEQKYKKKNSEFLYEYFHFFVDEIFNIVA